MDHALRPHRSAAAAAAAPATAGGREDCWSEGATEALVEAWGERFLQLNRGNLRQKDWQDVAIAVNDHQDALGKPRRTDVQCKNRVDTLKKKYKAEKEKARRGSSLWRFFSRMDYLVGPTVAAAGGGTGAGGGGTGSVKKNQHPAAAAAAAAAAAVVKVEHPGSRPPLTFKFKNRLTGNPTNTNPNPPPSAAALMRSRANQSSPASSESSRGDSAANGRRDLDEDEDDDEDDDDDDGGREQNDKSMYRLADVPSGLKRKWDNTAAPAGRRDHHHPRRRTLPTTNDDAGGDDDDDEVDGMPPSDAFAELAQAIVKFSEIYERVESSKHDQMVQLERQRMEFAKDLEFQRMQMFMDAQIELQKMKRPKRSSNSSSSPSPGEESQASYLPFAFFLTGFPALDH